MSRNRKLSLAIFGICLILVMAVSTFLIVNPAGEELPGVTEQVAFQSYVVVDVYRPVGGEMVLIYHQESHNVITNVGLHVLARRLANQSTWKWSSTTEGGNDKFYSVGAPTYIALSTDASGADATNSSWQAVDDSYPPAGTDIEITTGGLARQNAATSPGVFTQAVAYTPGGTPLPTDQGSLTYSLSRTFTVLAGFSFTGVQKAGLFTGVWTDPAVNDGSTSGKAISPLVAENTFTPVTLNIGDQIAVTWSITL